MYEPQHKNFIEEVKVFDTGPSILNKLNPIIAAINILLTQHPAAGEEFEKWYERFKTIGD